MTEQLTLVIAGEFTDQLEKHIIVESTLRNTGPVSLTNYMHYAGDVFM